MSERKRSERGIGTLQCQTNLVKQIGFVLYGTITTCNKRINHVFRNGVQSLLPTRNNRKTSDFITIAKARDRIVYHTGRTVSHSTVCRWIAQNELGFKLDGSRGQWIVDSVLFSDFLEHVSACPRGNKPYYRFHYRTSYLSATQPSHGNSK